jgi:hypothetical protein
MLRIEQMPVKEANFNTQRLKTSPQLSIYWKFTAIDEKIMLRCGNRNVIG